MSNKKEKRKRALRAQHVKILDEPSKNGKIILTPIRRLITVFTILKASMQSIPKLREIFINKRHHFFR